MKQKTEVPTPTPTPVPEVPKWFRFHQKKEWKKQRIQQIMTEYDEKTQIENTPLDEKDRQEYLKKLIKLNLGQLSQINHYEKIIESNPLFTRRKNKKPTAKHDLIDKWHKIDSKNSIIIRIYHKNRSSTDYMIAKHIRVITINNFSYIFPPNAGVYDNKHKKTCYAYYENNPFPIEFSDDFTTTDLKGGTFPDAELLKKTLKFEYAQKLAASEMSKKVDVTFILVIINLFLTAGIVIMCIKGFKLI